ncbi:hypothetical protein A4U88_3513 [Serratia marcescens]|nr:hypothetical protein A4U88_3513 [Serratia marcescens]
MFWHGGSPNGDITAYSSEECGKLQLPAAGYSTLPGAEGLF